MSIEKAKEFIKRLKEDDKFRHTVAGIDDPQAVKALLLCEKLVFNEQDLIDAIISGIERREYIISYIIRGWNFVEK